MPKAVTLPFFLEQVRFHQQDLRQQAKYLLFFVTKLVKLRDDGMELRMIGERLKDLTGKPLTDDDLKNIQHFFDAGGTDHEIERFKAAKRR